MPAPIGRTPTGAAGISPAHRAARPLRHRSSGGAAGAGANFNVVPGAAWFSLDRRFNPDEDLDEDEEFDSEDDEDEDLDDELILDEEEEE